jgi:hypothetical protein
VYIELKEAVIESDRCSSEEQKTGMVTGFKPFANLAKKFKLKVKKLIRC